MARRHRVLIAALGLAVVLPAAATAQAAKTIPLPPPN